MTVLFYILTSHILISPQTHHHLSLWLFFIRHPSGCEMTSRCVLIFISLMINDVEHLLICFLAVRMSSLETCATVRRGSSYFITLYFVVEDIEAQKIS